MRFTALFLLLILSVTFLAGSATAASFSSVKVGIGYDRQRFRLAREVSSVAALAWPVFALVEYRNVSQEDQFAINITPPDSSFSWHGTNVAAASYSRYLLSHLIPLAGTPNEKRTGTWRVTVSHQQDQQALEFQVVAANRSDLDAARAEQASNPGSFDANYRLGAAASMFGEDQLALDSLRRAAQIAPRNVYPHSALCRHHLHQQRKDDARSSCAMARGLLLGYEDRSLAAWLQTEIAKLLDQMQ